MHEGGASSIANETESSFRGRHSVQLPASKISSATDEPLDEAQTRTHLSTYLRRQIGIAREKEEEIEEEPDIFRHHRFQVQLLVFRLPQPSPAAAAAAGLCACACV